MQSDEMAGNRFLIEMLHGNTDRISRPRMSQQLTLSSLSSVLALVALCVVTSARDLAGSDRAMVATSLISVQAEPLPGLLP
jgi:hypothetical protein